MLLIDIGNTNTVCAIYDGEKYIAYERIELKKDFQKKIKQFNNCDIQKIAISSVVPKLTQYFIKKITPKPCFKMVYRLDQSFQYVRISRINHIKTEC